tara:strand:+ start:3860 stop:4819 length:960 start_codon:yes stop_codon:yes gene_type:complete
MFKKALIGITTLITSMSAYSNDFDNDKVKNDFLSRYDNENLFIFNVFNYKKLKEEEVKSVNKIYEANKNNSIGALSQKILNNNINNHYSVINYSDRKNAWIYPIGLEYDNFYNGNCSYLFFLSNEEDCLNTKDNIKNEIKRELKLNGIEINEDYFSKFYFVHELSHLIPKQKQLPNGIDKTRIWTRNVNLHYREIYSDLFSVIYLNNFYNEDIKNIDTVVAFRNFNLNANNDLVHFSTPYLKELLKRDDFNNLNTFEEINKYIEDLYLYINKTQIISKKNNLEIKQKNIEWCNNKQLTTNYKKVFTIIENHCKKIKTAR